MESYKKLLANQTFARQLAQESLLGVVNHEILCWMEEKKIDRAELARRLGRSRSFITQLLNGEKNITLRTLADVCWALGIHLELRQRTPLSLVLGSGQAYQITNSSVKKRAEQRWSIKADCDVTNENIPPVNVVEEDLGLKELTA